MSVTSDNPAHPWSSEKGMLLYRDHPVGMLYLGGDSLMPNPRLADVVAMRLNHYEEVNPGRLEVDEVAGVTTTEFARGPEDTGAFEWEDEAQTPPRAAPPGFLREPLMDVDDFQARLDAGARRAAEAPEEVKEAFREAFPATEG